MPATVSHALSMTTPDDPAYENQPQHWNSAHLFTMNAVGSEISNAFGNGGGVTFGLSADGKITASAPAGGGGLTNINVSAGTTSNNLSALTFSNGSGVTFGLNASTLTASVATSYRASNDAIGLNTALTAGPLAWTVNSAGLSLNAGSAAGTTSGFAGNLISGSMTHNSAGLNLSLNHPAWLTTARASNDAVGLATAQTNVTWTVNSNGISFNAGGYNGTGFTSTTTAGTAIVATNNTAGLSMGVPLFLTTAMLSNAATISNVGISGSNGGITASAFTFGNLNGLSFYTSNGSIVGSYTDGGGAGGGFSGGMSNLGNTAGTIGTVGSHLVFVGGSNITLSQSVNGNSATITLDHRNPYQSWFSNRQLVQTIAEGPNQASGMFAPFQLPWNLSAGFVQQINTISIASTSVATTANTTFSYQFVQTRRFELYSRATGADSMTLSRISSTTHGFTQSINVAVGTAGTQYTQQFGFTYPVSNGTSSYSSSFGVSNASLQVSTTHLTAFTGLKFVPCPWAISLSDGNYWMGIGWSTAQTTQHTAALSGARLQMSAYAMTNPNNTVATQFGQANNASMGFAVGLGSLSTNDRATVALSELSSIASQRIQYFELGRIA